MEQQTTPPQKPREWQTQLSICQSQNWHKYNLAKTNEKRLFYELLNELCQLMPDSPSPTGRPHIPIRDLFFMSCLKLYSNYSSRKIAYDLKLAESAGYIKRAPHFNRLSEFMNNPNTYELLQKLLTITAMPLKCLEDSYSIDSSGFGEYSYERWMRVRFGDTTKRGWRNYVKGHVSIGTRTNVICACEVTPGNFSDIKQMPRLLKVLEKNFSPKEISADKAYSAHRIFQIIDAMGATPFIVFKNNTNPSKNAPEIWSKMFNYFVKNKEDFLNHYHKRSNVETVFSMVKTRLGEFLKSKNYEAQRNELLVKFICHNICCLVAEIYENKIHIDFKFCMDKYVDAYSGEPKEELKETELSSIPWEYRQGKGKNYRVV